MLKTSTTVLWMGAAWGLALFGATQAAADPCEATESGKCTATDAEFGDRFGHAVAIDGNVAVMGAPDSDDYGLQSGSVYAFHFDGAVWTPMPKPTILDGDAEDQFGYAVSLSGDVLLVGAPYDEQALYWAGSAYVLRFNGATWQQEQKLLASDPAGLAFFGNSVAVQGNVAVIGAYNSGGKGAAYVYRYNGVEWACEDKLAPSGLALNDQFGISVSIAGDVALVGAHYDDDDGQDSGSAYVFRYNSETSLWDQEAKLTASDAGVHGGFGYSVSLSGDVALIGANYDLDLEDSGSAYVFRVDAGMWVEEAKLTAPPGAPPDDDYARSVSLSGDLVAVGSHFDSDSASSEGAAYFYERQFEGNSWHWNLVAKFIASDREPGDTFGGSVSIDAGTAFIGAAQDDPGGSAYSFEGLEDGTPDTCCPWDLDGNGSVAVIDFLQLLAAWGPNPGHPADFDGNGVVAVNDFLQLLAHWGLCP